jgi:hypothetical protein
VARRRGLSLVVITDHSNSAGSMDCETLDVEDCPNQGPEFPAREEAAAASGSGLQVAVGVEISPVESLETTSVPTGHVGCIPRPGDPFAGVDLAITDRPTGSVPGGLGVEWCQAAGGLAVVNHPFSIAGWIAYDWSSDAYDALEVFNGGGRFDANDAQGVDAWLCDLASGRETIAVGGSDTHRASTETPPPELLDQALGFPTTWVWAASDDRDVILAALEAGQVVVGDPRSSLDVVVRDLEEAAGPGETLRTGEDWVEVEIDVQVPVSQMLLQVIEVREEDCVTDPRWTSGKAPEYTPSLLDEVALEAGEPTSVALSVSTPTTLVVRAWPSGAPGLLGDGVILAGAIQVVAEE